MKKNLSLFSVLILLLVVTYFFQEKSAEESFLNSLTSGRLQTEDISTLDLPNVSAQKVNNQWKSGDVLLSHNTFRLIEKKLKEIKEVKNSFYYLVKCNLYLFKKINIKSKILKGLYYRVLIKQKTI